MPIFSEEMDFFYWRWDLLVFSLALYFVINYYFIKKQFLKLFHNFKNTYSILHSYLQQIKTSNVWFILELKVNNSQLTKSVT